MAHTMDPHPYSLPYQGNGPTGSLPGQGNGSPTPFSVSEKEVRNKAWRYKGYPAFSTWLASSDDAFTHEIGRLEKRLEEDDRACQNQPLEEPCLYLANSGSFRNDELHRPQRTQILHSLIPMLEQLVLYHSELKARPSAPKSTIRNVERWFEDNGNAIAESERQFIERGGDLIPMVHHEKTPLRHFLEKFEWLFSLSWVRKTKLRDHHYNKHYDSDTEVYYSDTVVDSMVTIIVLFLGLGMLPGPAWWLTKAANSSLALRLEIISIFVPLFLILLTLVVPTKPFETVAATSAYAAVLMVFMQLGASNNSNCPSDRPPQRLKRLAISAGPAILLVKGDDISRKVAVGRMSGNPKPQLSWQFCDKGYAEKSVVK
ncbi:hypothetical protein B0A49_09330 [Cryomyces minteri]|uniref:DUF6594 domain-containing protein n=1 Tax=Cryomyces minteri TaxID=331657 RepID=A0A4U0WRD4_9PEZI|nr:hypothetical protein B0A49_09330 [Cryomyces minteri]